MSWQQVLAQLGALKKIHVLRQLSLLCDLAGFTISELVLGLLDTNLKDSHSSYDLWR